MTRILTSVFGVGVSGIMHLTAQRLLTNLESLGDSDNVRFIKPNLS